MNWPMLAAEALLLKVGVLFGVVAHWLAVLFYRPKAVLVSVVVHFLVCDTTDVFGIWDHNCFHC